MKAAFAPAIGCLVGHEVCCCDDGVSLVDEVVAATVVQEVLTYAEVMSTGSIRCLAPVGYFDAVACAVVAFSVAEVTMSPRGKLHSSCCC